MVKNIGITILIIAIGFLSYFNFTKKEQYIIRDTDTIFMQPNVTDSTVYSHIKVYDTVKKTYVDTVIYRKTYTDTLIFTDFDLQFNADVVGDIKGVSFIKLEKPIYSVGGAIGYKHFNLSLYYKKKKWRYGLGYDFYNKTPTFSIAYKFDVPHF